MKTKRQEQFRTSTCSVQRLHSWVTAKILMLLVMLIVGVQGALAQVTVDHVQYELFIVQGRAEARVIGIEDGVTDVVIQSSISQNNRDYIVTSISNSWPGLFYEKSYRSVTFINDEKSASSISIPFSGFYGCTELERVILPRGLSEIGDGFFNGCTKLVQVQIPEHVTSIGANAFRGCTLLTTMYIPDGVTSIGQYAFRECTSLRNIEIPNSVTTMGTDVFNGCTALESAKPSGGVSIIPMYTFNGCTSLRSVTIPEGVTKIEDFAFNGCALSSLSIPASLTNLNEDRSGLHDCIKTLTSITIDPANETYDSRDNCNAVILKSYSWLILGCRNTIIPDGVSVRANAFENCTALKTLTLPKHVELRYNSLEGCTSLETIICTGTDPSKISFELGFKWPVPNSALTVKVPFRSLEAYRNSPKFTSYFNASQIIADPTTEKKHYVSNLQWINSYDTESTQYRCNDGLVYREHTSTGEPITLGYDLTTSVFNGITGVVLMRICEGNLVNDTYVIDRKTYRKVGTGREIPTVSVHDDSEGRNYNVNYYLYVTNDGNDVAGTKLLSRLESVTSSTPLEDENFIMCASIDRSHNMTMVSNQDWNQDGSGDPHVYTYVRAIYDEYQAPLDEIHYITTDNSQIEFANDVFGSENIIEEHTYKNGVGVIKFQQDATGVLSAAFAGNTKLSQVMLPVGITGIADGAFRGCTAMQNISLSGNLTSIGSNAFNGCSALVSFSMPEKVTTLGAGAFEGCASLSRISVSKNITTIGERTFKGCGFERIVLPANLTSIGTSAFEGCQNIVDVNFKDLKKLASIGNRSFYGCATLKNVHFWDTQSYDNDVEPYTECEIGSEAFANCPKLISVAMQKLSRIGAKAFDGCVGLYFDVAKYSGNLTTDFADDAFSKNAVRRINICGADQITEIPAGKFQGYWNLNRFTFPDNLTTIGANAFAGSGMWNLNISHLSKLTDIGEGAFSGCEQLGTIILPSSLTTIKATTFKGCKNLKTINLNNSVQNIGEEAFANCPDLQTVVFGPALQSIGSKAFAGCKSNMEVVTNLTYKGVYATNLDCFDNSVYLTGILHMIGETKGNEAIYENAPWKEFKNKDIGGTYYYVQDGSTYRLYPDNYETLDGRLIRGAVLIDGKSRNYPDVVNEDFPVVAFATGSISGDVGYLGIPGSVIRLEEGFISPSTDIWGIGFDRGSDTLYVDKTLNIPTIHDIRINRDIECLRGGLFEGFHTTDPSGITLTIDRDATYLSKYCFRWTNTTELIFRSNELFGFEKGAFDNCMQIRNVRIESSGAGMDESRCSSSTFVPHVFKNATVTWSGSDRYKSYQPWVNFVDPEVTQVTVDGATYKIYPRCSYNYNIRGDYGAKNLTGAVLTGGSFSGDVVIPDRVHGFPVIGIAKGPFYDNDNVTSISFPGTLRMIENNAVEKMSNLKTVVFRDQLFPRGEKCYIGYSVYSVIDEEAFYECDALEEVSIGCDLDWCEWKDEPFEDRDNLKTIRITKGCHEIGKDYGDSPYLFNDCEGIKNLIIEDSEDLFYFRENIFSKLSLDYLYLGRTIDDKCLKDDDYSPFYGRRVDKLVVGDCVQYINKWLFKHGTVHIEQLGRNIKSIGYEAFSWADISLSPDCYCPNLEVIGEEAFDYIELLSDFYSFWFDPNNPSESKLRRIEYKGINWQPGEGKDHIFDKVYLPATLEYLGAYSLSSFSNQIRNVYFYPNLHEKTVEIDPEAFDEDIYETHHRDVFKVHTVCANSDKGKCGFPKITIDGGDDVEIPFYYDLHVIDSKEGSTLHSDGLYHEVCKACGTDDGRSAKSGNYYIHNWNGTDDIMIHKDGSSYTYAGPLAIDDSMPFQSPVNFSAESVSYNRTVTGGRVVTFVLPFASNALDVNGTVYKFREFSGGKFCFDEQKGTLNANTPYLVVVNEDATQLLSNVSAQSLAATVSNTLSPLACNVTGSDEMAQHVGTFVQQSLKDGDNGKSYYGYASNDGAFVKAKNATLKPFRTMFSLPQATQVKNVMLQLGDDDSETDIIQVDADLLDGEGSPIYDLNGHIVTAPIRGQIYIQNGKKMIGK